MSVIRELTRFELLLFPQALSLIPDPAKLRLEYDRRDGLEDAERSHAEDWRLIGSILDAVGRCRRMPKGRRKRVGFEILDEMPGGTDSR